ncbi:MAG: AMP-binding protein [Deltaproteobacteria bacterium]|nr:AMP-binding protein [Nannocystaceae bacterium]
MLELARIGSIGEALRDSIVTHKNNIALIEADRHRENVRYTYRELREHAERFAASLQSADFAPGHRCAILMQNQSKWLISATGVLWAGGVLMPLDYKLTAKEQLALLAHGKPRVLVTEHSRWLDLRKEADHSVLDRMLVLVTEAPEGAELGRAQRWEQDPKGAFAYVPRTRSDIACIVYSSGTSGTAKGCMLTHDNYLEQAQILGRMYPMAEDDRYFSVLPTNHAIDFMVGFIGPMLFGAAVVHQRTLRPQFLRATLKKYEITHIALVPTILKNLEERIREKLDELSEWQRRAIDGLTKVNEWLTAKRPRPELSRRLLKPLHDELGGKLRLIFAGGAFIDPNTARFFYELGFPVVIGYGLTEASTVISVNDLEPFRPDTVGKPIAGVEVEVRDANAFGVGELWVRGRTVMAGYLDAPELTAESIVDGWLRTGDLGIIDAAGHIKLLGRAKNMIVTEGGKNIYPEDIESYFEDLPDCEEFCVFAADYIWPQGKMTGEQLVVVIRPEQGAEASSALVDELRKRNRRLADFKRLSGYIVETDEFPATASLKVKRNVLAERLRARERSSAILAIPSD